MDWLTFVAEMVKAAAWPMAAVAIALIFRPQLRTLLGRLNKGRLGPAEFEFERELRELAAQSAALRSAGPRSAGPRSAGPGAATAAVLPSTGSARAAIAAAWRDLQHAAPPDMQMLAAADRALYQQLDALQELAPQAGEFNPSPESVNAYVQLARGLQARLQRGQAG